MNTIDADSLERFDDFQRRKSALYRGPELLRERAFKSLLFQPPKTQKTQLNSTQNNSKATSVGVRRSSQVT